jgi:hypothetical protein
VLIELLICVEEFHALKLIELRQFAKAIEPYIASQLYVHCVYKIAVLLLGLYICHKKKNNDMRICS